MDDEEIIRKNCGKRNGELWLPSDKNVNRIRDMMRGAREEERERITDLTRRAKQNKIGSCLCCKTQEYFKVPRTWKVARPIMKLYGAKALDYICFRCFFYFEKLEGEGLE